MADYWTHTSFVIPAKTEEELEWWENALGHATECERDDEYEGYSEELVAAATDQGLNFEDHYLNDWTVEKAEKRVWVRSDESFSPEIWAVFLQAFIRKFHPGKFFGFEYAFDCSKHMLDAFGGGACYVDAEGVEFTTTGVWLGERYNVAAEGGGEEL